MSESPVGYSGHPWDYGNVIVLCRSLNFFNVYGFVQNASALGLPCYDARSGAQRVNLTTQRNQIKAYEQD